MMPNDLPSDPLPKTRIPFTSGKTGHHVVKNNIVSQVNTSVIRYRGSQFHQSDVVLANRSGIHFDKTCISEAFEVEIAALQPPLVITVVVWQFQAQLVIEVVAHEGIAVEHAMMECATHERRPVSTGGVERGLRGRPADNQPRDPPSLNPNTVSFARVRLPVRVTVDHRYKLSEVFGSRYVLRMGNEVIVTLGDVATWQIAEPLTVAGD